MKSTVLRSRMLGVALGLLADRVLGEPPDAWHPVVWFGTTMTRYERAMYADHKPRGVAHTLFGAGMGLAAGMVLRRLGSAGVMTAVAVASAGSMLRHTARSIEELFWAQDLYSARERLPWLVGRDPSALDESGVAAAVIESLAENTVDAVLAPACWALVAGAPGVLVHRAVNTMDAMVGHRSARYVRYGWAAARADDVMAWAPARAHVLLVGTLNPLMFRQVLRTVRRDAPGHPSPNAGVAEAAVAAALGVQLGGPLTYGLRHEERPRLGEGPRPRTEHLTAARRLTDRVELTVVALCLAVWWSTRPRDPTRARRPQ